jgi:hypothetical protein
MGTTATWVITTEPRRFLDDIGDRFAPLADWSPSADLGEVRSPWTVLEAYEIDGDASTAVMNAWTEASGSPLLVIGVFDSDGVDVGIVGSSFAGRAFIGVEGYAGSIFPGYSPFDEAGNMLKGAALAEREAASEAEFARVCAQMRAGSLTSSQAAAALHGWAQESGLAAEAPESIERVFERQEVFAEDSVRSLISALGMRWTRAQP